MSYGVPVGRNSQPMVSGTGCTSGSSGSWSWAGTAMMGKLVWHTGGTTKWGHQQCTWSSPWLLVALVPNCLHGIGSWHPCWLQCQWPSGFVHLGCQLNFPWQQWQWYESLTASLSTGMAMDKGKKCSQWNWYEFEGASKPHQQSAGLKSGKSGLMVMPMALSPWYLHNP